MEFTLPIINNPVDHTKPVRPVRVPEAVETGKKA